MTAESNFYREGQLMITDQVIKEIYKKFKKPPRNKSELNLDRIVELLKDHHPIRVEDGEVIIGDSKDFDPFKRFLVRGVHAVLEFDHDVAFVFKRHILFLGKDNDDMRVHIKPEEKKSIFSRIFGGDDD